MGHLRIFGCRVFSHVPKELRRKLDPKGKEHIFIGYCEDSKGYRLIDPETNKIIKSRDVTFLEEGYKEDSSHDSNFVHFQISGQTDEKKASQDDDETEDSDDDTETSSHHSDIATEESEPEQLKPNQPNQPNPNQRAENETTLRRSTRVPKPVKRDDYCMYFAPNCTSDDPETVTEALNSPDKSMWMKAMREEYESLVKNDT